MKIKVIYKFEKKKIKESIIRGRHENRNNWRNQRKKDRDANFQNLIFSNLIFSKLCNQNEYTIML